jgi:hypothetical protein
VVVLSVAVARARFLVYCCFEPARLSRLMHITWRDLIITAWMSLSNLATLFIHDTVSMLS